MATTPSVRQRARPEPSSAGHEFEPQQQHQQRQPTLRSASDSRRDSPKSVIYKTELGYGFWFFVVGAFLAACLFIHSRASNYPPPASVDASAEGFLESEARRHVEELCSYGHRHVGERSNEVEAPRYLLDQLASIQRQAESVHSVEFQEQVVTGCYFTEFRGGCTTCYNNLTNIVARIGPKPAARHSILVNCHFDTAISSPGASDDAVSCAIMLDVIRALATSKTALRHSVTFLFNGGEETNLQGSHGFITKHPWRHDIKNFINLEAAGAGGHEIVFQAGPENPWLVSAYAKAAVSPSASVLGQELFQSGLIPSDTDFRNFRDFGNLSGIDIAYIRNGYVYHTKYDRPEAIPKGCIQRGGNNVLALLRLMATSDEVVDPGIFRHGAMLYFDVMGLFIVTYTERIGCILNYFIAICALLVAARKIRPRSSPSAAWDGASVSSSYGRQLAVSVVLHLAALACAAVTVAAVARLMSAVRPQSWFTNVWLVAPLYAMPAACSWTLCHQTLGKLLYPSGSSADQREDATFRASLLVWTVLLLLMTSNGLASAFLPMLFVAFPLLIRVLPMVLLKRGSNEVLWMVVTLTTIAAAVPTLIAIQQFYNLFVMVVPVIGRLGTSSSPELIVGLLPALLLVISAVNVASLLHISKNLTNVVIVGYGLSVIAFLFASTTSYGFPYQTTSNAITPQRLILMHVQKEVYAEGVLTKTDSNLLFFPWDYAGHRSLTAALPEVFHELRPLTCDADAPYCGVPYFFPTIFVHSNVYGMPLPPHKAEDSPSIQLLRKEKRPGSTYRFYFQSSAHNYINIYISPKPDVTLSRWSFTTVANPTRMPPQSTNRTHYFVYNVFAKEPRESFEFWIDLKIATGAVAAAPLDDRHLVDIAFAVHDINGPHNISPPLQNVIQRLPEWTSPIAWVASYKVYEY